MSLVVYGDFVCPYSALASARVDELLARGEASVDWRAVEHDPGRPRRGEPLRSSDRISLELAMAAVAALSAQDVRLTLRVPAMAYSPRLANAVFAATHPADRHRVRRRLFAAVWAEDRNIGNYGELARLCPPPAVESIGRHLRHQAAITVPATELPAVVTGTGTVLQGSSALAYLAALVHPATSGTPLRSLSTPGRHAGPAEDGCARRDGGETSTG